MNIPQHDALVGAVAFKYVLEKLKVQLDDPHFHGAFHVLSGFTPEQLVGFINAKEAVGAEAQRIKIQIPEFVLREFGVDAAHTTSRSSVNVRNKNRDSLMTITAGVEEDAKASLADSDMTDAAELKSNDLASTWVDFVAKAVDVHLLPEERRRVEAMLKGLFASRRCPTGKAGEFLTGVLEMLKAGEPLQRAAGKSLPAIGLPLFEDCFTSLKEAKLGQPSQWAAKFKSHYLLECYLEKRGLSHEVLDPDDLRATLDRLKLEEQQPPMPDDVLVAFSKYIESEGGRTRDTSDLLFKFDWRFTSRCFDRAKRSSPKEFSQRTREALENEGVSFTTEDTFVLDALTTISPRPGTAQEEFRDFFERNNGAISKDARLHVEWENFVHDRKIECQDLFQGIFECIQRSMTGLSLHEDAVIVLEGRRQDKPNSFLELNRRACEFFQRSYGDLQTRTKGRIKFAETKICKYSEEILPKIKDKKEFKGSLTSAKATTLNFFVSIVQKQRGGSESPVVTLALAWKFPFESVLGQEGADFDSLCRYYDRKKTALVECSAEYEVVGRKGFPSPLSLENVSGFSDLSRGNGRGSFVPAQDRIKSLSARWEELLSTARKRELLPDSQAVALSDSFVAFESSYNAAISDLRKSALAGDKVSDVVEKYSGHLLLISNLGNQDVKHNLLHAILQVGLAQIPRSGHRPPVAVICPWHPLRMEAVLARQQQIFDLIEKLLGKNRPPFSDGGRGALFFREVEQLLAHALYPEMAGVWDNKEVLPRVVAQALGGYTLHLPVEPADVSNRSGFEDDSRAAAATIEHEVNEYLRLQPHERDNFSVLLYDCESPAVPMAIVECINAINAKREDDKITCQVLLMHGDMGHLRRIYRDLVARGVETDADPTESSGDFLAKVRVSITAASHFPTGGRSQPVDIAYCRDLLSRKAKVDWKWVQRETLDPVSLRPHQWSRRLPVSEGARRVLLQLVCPVQTEAGWTYLYSLSILCTEGATDAWRSGQCQVQMWCLDFDDKKVARIFKETHELATWVVNQDELLDRKLLEAQEVKVIRYVQSATHGRNLIISSTARDTLLVNTLKEKLKLLLPSSISPEAIKDICSDFMDDANRISGGLALKAARRANNTNELLGMVLSRYLIQSEIEATRPIAWCFLDDYSQWLGKKDGASIADLLVLAPTISPDGTLHLDVVVTEAKFVTHDGLGIATNTSAKQLMDTLSQLAAAMDGAERTLDQDIWLARLSDLLVAQIVAAPGRPSLDLGAWRRAIRDRQCSFRIWGYSHVFVYEADDIALQISTVKGIEAAKGKKELDSLQEIFGPEDVRKLVMQYSEDNFKATTELRLKNGHPPFGKTQLYHLSTKLGAKHKDPPDDVSGGGVASPDPVAPTPEPSSSVVTELIPDEVIPSSPAASPEMIPVPVVGAPTNSGGSPLIAFLESRSALITDSDETGKAWLEDITLRLRQSLITRTLPAKLIEGLKPILTPNAGIIKLQGSKDLTVQAVESRASEIFTSEGIKIISTTPESGRVSIAVERPQRQVLHTETVLLSYLRNYSQETMGEKLCVGIREEDGQPLLLDPFSQPHTLVAGITGSGKSVLMQNLILNIAATRSPEEAHIYLIDPKYGVDYRPLDELPHVEEGSGAIIDDPSEAIKVLGDLVVEMNERYALFKKERGVQNIHTYRRVTGKPMPTIWVIHDEFADWMQTEDYQETVPDIVGRLGAKARAAGIFLIFAAQRPDKDVMPPLFRSQLGNRLILKVDNAATAEIAMGTRNSGAEKLLGRGHMLAKTGDMSEAVFAQVPFIDNPTITKLVRLIRAQYGRQADPHEAQ